MNNGTSIEEEEIHPKLFVRTPTVDTPNELKKAECLMPVMNGRF